VIEAIIKAQPGAATVNAIVEPDASVADMRAAWENVLNGTLQHQVRDAICFECHRRGIDYKTVVVEPAAN